MTGVCSDRFAVLRLTVLAAFFVLGSHAQTIHQGSVVGTVQDDQSLRIPGATVELRNTITGVTLRTQADDAGNFRIENVPPEMYNITASAPGFSSHSEPLEVAAGPPSSIEISLNIAPVAISVDVTATAPLIDTDPSAHTDVKQDTLAKLPRFDPASGLSSLVTNTTGGVAADANGFFHPLGDHGQVSFIIDGQPVTDQQSKAFSTQIPANALQTMQLDSGAPGAQFGDKSSLVVQAATKSGLNGPTSGSLELVGGTFGTWGENATFGTGNAKWGNYLTADSLRTGRFLDTPEFRPIHAIGNNGSIFDHIDYQPNYANAYHLNLSVARNWTQIPNSYDQLAQDQKQRVMSFNVAPSYQHTFASASVLTVNAFARRDQVNFYGSRNPFNDTPVTSSQLRFLTNYGFKVDVATAHRFHTVRYGMQIQRTDLAETFGIGVTNPALNPVCLNNGAPVVDPSITDPATCSAANPAYVPNPDLLPALTPYDLTRGGTPFRFRSANGINQYSFYVTDTIQWREWSINAGLRDDQYNGLVTKNGLQPRVGVSYLVHPTNTVLRLAYSRTFETPFNENLLLSSSTGAGGLAQNVFGAQAAAPIQPGSRNQYNAGFQQQVGQFLVIDVDYFWKFTHNAYDFDVVFNTPIAFPIAWQKSKLDGVTGRVSTTNFHGFQAYWTFGHTRARFFPQEIGGLVFRGTANVPGVFRIDHDQAYQQTVNLRYQRGKDGPWFSWIWRYDSGLVVTGVPNTVAALSLTGNQQTTVGLTCDGVAATPQAPLRDCSGTIGSALLKLPTADVANLDHNPARVQPRHVFDVAFGTDNLFRADRRRVTLRVTLTNLTNKVAVYNFLSTFSGTHFLAPRTVQVAVGYSF